MTCIHPQLLKHWIILYFILNVFLGYSLETEYIPNDWVDPNDMRNYVRFEKTMKIRESNSLNIKMESTHPFNMEYKDCGSDVKRYNIFIERFINRLIKVSELNYSTKDEYVSSDVAIKISIEKLRTLISLGEQFSSSKLTELDEILSSMFTKETQYGSAFVLSYSWLWDCFVNSKEMLAVFTLATIAFFSLWMFGTGKSIYRIVSFLYLTSFLLGLIWNWWIKYQEILIQQYMEIKKYPDVPIDCTPTKWWSIIAYLNPWYKETNDCLQYYKAHNIHPLSELKPSLIFSETFTMFFMHPLNELSKAIQTFCFELSGTMPWPLNLLVYPVFVVILLLFVLSCMSLCFAKEIRIWSYLGGFTIGSGSERGNVDRQMPGNIRNGINHSADVPPSLLPAGNTFQNCSVLFTRDLMKKKPLKKSICCMSKTCNNNNKKNNNNNDNNKNSNIINNSKSNNSKIVKFKRKINDINYGNFYRKCADKADIKL